MATGIFARWNGFLLVLKFTKLTKSELSSPHSILMQELNYMREKNIKPEIFREAKSQIRDGMCQSDVVDHNL